MFKSLLLGLLILRTTASTVMDDSALERAQSLHAPKPRLSYQGEGENDEWWEEHKDLLEAAREQWGHKHEELYLKVTDEKFIGFLDPTLLSAVETRDKARFSSLLNSTNVEDVYTVQLFTEGFTKLLLEELDFHEASGIPLRRPNGMNRFGAILQELGLAAMIDSLASTYLIPMARILFQKHVGPANLMHNYPFIVRYQPGQDVSLSEHADASTVTVNVCLHADQSVLYFKEQRSWHEPSPPKDATFVDLTAPGQAVIHLGRHIHGVAEVTSHRANLVVWMFGEHGYVRVAPYEDDEVQEYTKAYDTFWNENSIDNQEL